MAAPEKTEAPVPAGMNFIERIIEEDNASGKHGGRVHTRFPPEPNGYLHIGHAKSICLNFGLAQTFKGKCNLRFDDTNPAAEDVEYVDSIQEDIRWLGFTWDNLFYASDYYEKIHAYAVELIKMGKAYVCDLTQEEIRKYKGTPTEAGKDSPYRTRSIEENLALFEKMRRGEFEEGKCILRAKIDMASPNFNLRDPAIYRIKKAHHHRTGDKWCIYPMYDFAHGFCDAAESISHSICTLEFEDHRPLYDWFLDVLNVKPHPQQIEFARLGLTYTVMSKRKLLQLVKEKLVDGWDDPRMPTLCGYRRRGYTPESIRGFAKLIGVSKANTTIDVGILEGCIRDDLNAHSPRAMCVLKPLKVVIENYPEGQTEEVDVPNHPQHPEMGTRKVKFARELFIEQDDFMENPPKSFFRLAPGREVRLRSGYFIKCTSVVKDAAGNITELRCTYDPATRGGDSPDKRKVKGTLHWVTADAPRLRVRLYDRLFNVDNPDGGPEGTDFKTFLNPASVTEVEDARGETMLGDAAGGSRFQFERLGYFYVDPKDSKPGAPVFNRVVTLKDTWAKVVEKEG